MKKIVCVLCLMVLVSATFAVDRIWTNGSGDRNFARGSNWFDVADGYVFNSNDRPIINMNGSNAPILNSNVICQSLFLGYNIGTTGELLITGGTNAFVSGVFAFVADTNGYMTVSGGTTNFSGFFTVGYTGYGLLTITDGVLTVNRSQICQNVGSQGEYVISGGQMNITTYLTVGSNGEGSVNMSGGTLNVLGGILKLGDVAKASKGTVTLSGNAILNVPTNSVIIGEDGYGILNMNGGTLNSPSISLGFIGDPNSQGYVYVTDGTINNNTYFTVGSKSKGLFDISGGVVNTNRMTIAQGVIGEVYPTTGFATISGGELNIVDYIEVGRDAAGVLTLDGNAGKIKCAQFEIGGLSTARFILNGASGVGNGIGAFAGVEMEGIEEVTNEGNALFKEGATVDASFAAGTSVAGDYVVIASSEPAAFLPAAEIDEALAVPFPAGDATDILSVTAQSEGWKATMFDAGSGSALVLSSPVIAAKTAWGSAGANDIAVLDSGSATLSSAKTSNGAVIGDTAAGTLDVAAGAAAAFVNLTIGADASSAGTVNMSAGTVAVQSLAFIGKEGDAALNISGGSFSALNLIAATGADSSADIKISGDASFDVDNMLALTDGATLTVSGYQTTVNVANLTLDDGANITFELDSTNGVGNGIIASGNVVLDGTISIDTINTRVDNTYTVIRAEGRIFDNTPVLVDSPFVSYEIVQNGEYNELQVTLFTPETCEDVVNNGFALAADANRDCQVDIEDISVYAAQWLTCNDPARPECDWLQQ